MRQKNGKILIFLLTLLMLLAMVGSGWAENAEYTIVLEYNDGISRPHRVYVQAGSALTEPALPLRAGYDFVGWSKTGEGDVIDFPYTPAGNETLQAVWEARKCVVTFSMGLEGQEDIVLRAEYGAEISTPEVPEVENMSFMGWSSTADGNNSITFPVTAEVDTTYYAIWVEGDLNIVELDLNYEGGGIWTTFTLAKGDGITKKMITEPERENYKFSGWSETKDGKAIKFPYKPEQSTTLYAIWKRNEYKVAFRNEYTDNPTVVFLSTKVDGGESVNEPDTIPVREGYIFTGWYTAAVGGEKVEFPYTPTGNTAIYAQWQHEPVVTDVFQAEYVFIDPNETFPGYSGEARGTGIIAPVTTEIGVVVDEDAPLNSKYVQRVGNYVTYLYKNGAVLEFVINSTEDTTARLTANLAIEIETNWSFTPTGENAYKVYINGEELDYGAITFSSNETAGPGYKSSFQQFYLGTVQLKAGKNTIQLMTANSNKVFGGTMQAVAPMVDCIMLNDHTGELSWSPIYDNLD